MPWVSLQHYTVQPAQISRRVLSAVGVTHRHSVRGGKAISWSIVLVGRESPYPIQLAIGENELGSLHRERALEIARKVGTLVGIEVVES